MMFLPRIILITKLAGHTIGVANPYVLLRADKFKNSVGVQTSIPSSDISIVVFLIIRLKFTGDG
jgi:hypothetical protein